MIYLEYNTDREHLIIPEYGRYVQKMIEQAIAIENKEERNKRAKAIIGIMGNMNPHLRDVPDFQHKLWDQLFIMSDFKLDVDSPFEKPTKALLEKKPPKLPYPQNFPQYRFYGNNIKKIIDVCSEDKNLNNSELHYSIANHMKRCYLNWNKDTVEDEVIFQHLSQLSNGKINLGNNNEELSESKNLTAQSKQNFYRKKKKRTHL